MIQTALGDILHVISQGLLVPVIILLIAFIAYALFCIGSVVAEYFTERKHFQVVMPKFLAALMAAEQDEIPRVIEDSGLLNRQKTALLTVYDYRMLPGDALVALIKREVNQEESRYERVTSRNNVAARVAPMIGLMGTLIPLGPGVEALGRADTAALSSSLLVAFDTTVAGLIVAAVCMVIGKIRSNWYDNYLSALDAGMATMLEKIETMREAGEIKTEKPTDYAFMFEQRIGGAGRAGAGAGAVAQNADVRAASERAANAKPEPRRADADSERADREAQRAAARAEAEAQRAAERQAAADAERIAAARKAEAEAAARAEAEAAAEAQARAEAEAAARAEAEAKARAEAEAAARARAEAEAARQAQAKAEAAAREEAERLAAARQAEAKAAAEQAAASGASSASANTANATPASESRVFTLKFEPRKDPLAENPDGE